MAKKVIRYKLSPKMLLAWCLEDLNIHLSESQINALWVLFESRMRDSGYVHEEGGDK